MSEPIVITKIKDYEGKLCWQCPFDKTLYLHTDNFIKHMAFLHNLNIPEFEETQNHNLLKRDQCDAKFFFESDLGEHRKIHSKGE